jgi:uroporphyrinogen-III synthase
VGVLAGRRVVVTRAAGQADALAELLRAAGAEPVVVPLVEVVPEPAGVAELAALDPAVFEWLVVTSPNAAHAYAAARKPAPPAVAAVGATTATALAAAGLPAGLVPVRQSATGLVEEFPAGAGRVLVVQAVEGEAVLADGLAAKGWQVTVVRPYRSAPVVPGPAERAAAAGADAVLFASGSAARAWVAVFGPVAPPVVVAIGPQTATAVERAGLKVSSIAADHSLAGLIRALEVRFSSRR